MDQLETLAIGGIRLAINGFLLWVLWYCLWRPQFVADTRQRLFEIRDRLFLRTQKEAKGFDFEAYRLLEASINRAIRHADRMTLFRYLAAILAVKQLRIEASRLEVEWSNAIDKLPTTTYRLDIQELKRDLSYVVVRQFVISSPLLWPVAAITFVVVVAHAWRSAKKSQLRQDFAGSFPALDRVEAQAAELEEAERFSADPRIPAHS